MDSLEVIGIRQGRLQAEPLVQHSGRVHVLADGAQAGGTLGMPRAHLVAQAIGMGDIGGCHRLSGTETPAIGPGRKRRSWVVMVPMIHPIRGALETHPSRANQTAFGSVKFSIADSPCSRPTPDSPDPPQGNR